MTKVKECAFPWIRVTLKIYNKLGPFSVHDAVDFPPGKRYIGENAAPAS
jgi:hypothetical protein